MVRLFLRFPVSFNESFSRVVCCIFGGNRLIETGLECAANSSVCFKDICLFSLGPLHANDLVPLSEYTMEHQCYRTWARLDARKHKKSMEIHPNGQPAM